ncbi:MAG: ParD-like family protein [Psychrosphaera sp.]|nr:ParD-like family protein [Psychrosphaera sp.]
MITASVRLDSLLIAKASAIDKDLNCTAPAQIEHWAKVGAVMEDNPDLTYEFVKQVLVAKAERDDGKLEPYRFN